VLKKIIFLDRDGVINKEIGYLHRIEDFVFIDGIFETLREFRQKGYEFVVITNQSGIGRGMYSEENYKTLDRWMKSQFEKNGILILDSFHCPHLPSDNCSCRKPLPGLFYQCFKKYNISKEKSWMIGDSETDIISANAAGIKNTLLVESGHPISKDIKNIPIIPSIKEANKVVT